LQHHGLVGTLTRFLPFADPNVEVCLVRDIDNTLTDGNPLTIVLSHPPVHPFVVEMNMILMSK
jgi:hypothetical protein